MLLAVFIALFSFVGCNKQVNTTKAEILLSNENLVVIKVIEASSSSTLMDAMNYLKQNGEMDFEVSLDGMINSINGIKNAPDWSSFWAIYTSDAEMSNLEWGTFEYNGKILGSAILGANTLIVQENFLYVWAFN